MNWIKLDKTKGLLPKNNQIVLVYDGGKICVARFECGISKIQRWIMQNNFDRDKVYEVDGEKVRRSTIYKRCDENEYNKTNYCWVNEKEHTMWYGDDVIYWANLDELPLGYNL